MQNNGGPSSKKTDTAGGCLNYTESWENKDTVREIAASCHRLDKTQLRIILTNAALQLYFDKNRRELPKSCLVCDFFEGMWDPGEDGRLFKDLLGTIPADKFREYAEKNENILNKTLKYVRGEDTLGFLYTSLLTAGRRRASGAYYTPAKTARRLVERLESCVDLKGAKILDPCCGAGNFLLCLSGSTEDCSLLFGFDIDPLAVQLCRINLMLNYQVSDPEILYKNIVCRDSLKGGINEEYDAIIGNPPWGKDFRKAETERLRKKYKTAVGNIESCDLFLERSFQLLRRDGFVAFVLPEAVLNVKVHEAARSVISDNASFKFVDYIGNVFSGVQCPAVIMGLQNNNPGRSKGCSVAFDGSEYVISENRQMSNAFNFNVTDSEQLCLETIESGSRVFLKDNARFALGIVTGNNKLHLSDTEKEGYEIILRGSDIRRFRTEITDPVYIRFEPSLYQQVAPAEIYRAREKLLYRFIGRVPVFAYDSGQRLSLNSCNILIPQIEGYSVKYVLAVLNSSAAAFYCIKSFNSVKLLRSHIEQIPIPAADKTLQEQVEKHVDMLIEGKKDREELFRELDLMITELYGLKDRERQIVQNAVNKEIIRIL